MFTTTSRWVVGCMTGTSLDGLDAALVNITDRGRDMTARCVSLVSKPFTDELHNALHQLASGEPHPPQTYLRAARQLGALHAAAVVELCEQHLPRHTSLAFVAAHGQTIHHAPAEHLSWQLLDPWPIVRRLGVPVVYDLRQADLIAGGEGAPITPIADPILYRQQAELVFNLGGICNYTSWQDGDITGGDVTVCNLLLDGLTQRLVPGKRYDNDGQLAMQGQSDANLVTRMVRVIETSARSANTLGREQFGDAFFNELERLTNTHHTPGDVLASAVEAIAIGMDDVVKTTRAQAVVLAGGGARNSALVSAIRRRHEVRQGSWQLSDTLGIPCEAREAAAFAVLGALCDDGVPITLPKVTGAETPGIAGAWAGRGSITDHL